MRRLKLEHLIWSDLRLLFPTQRNFVLAVSGGLDSMALLNIFANIASARVTVLHVHHGEMSNRVFRDEACELVNKEARRLNLNYIERRISERAESESEMRRLRKLEVDQVLTSVPNSILVTGHHAQDLLETRLIRLIRGTGVKGFVSFEAYNGHVWRPLLAFDKYEIKNYAQERQVKWVDDPTNSESKYLRNWLRNEWLQSLAANKRGSIKALSRSLENLAQELRSNQQNYDFSEGIDLTHYLRLSVPQQKNVLAAYLLHLLVNNYSQSHIDEIRKRLDNLQKESTFVVARCVWSINAGRIIATPK